MSMYSYILELVTTTEELDTYYKNPYKECYKVYTSLDEGFDGLEDLLTNFGYTSYKINIRVLPATLCIGFTHSYSEYGIPNYVLANVTMVSDYEDSLQDMSVKGYIFKEICDTSINARNIVWNGLYDEPKHVVNINDIAKHVDFSTNNEDNFKEDICCRIEDWAEEGKLRILHAF